MEMILYQFFFIRQIFHLWRSRERDFFILGMCATCIYAVIYDIYKEDDYFMSSFVVD